MIVTPGELLGTYILRQERRGDERGYFARTFCRKELRAHEINDHIEQINVSHSTQRGTVRGLHYQVAPYEESKIVSCLRGSVFDVLVDLRPTSTSFHRWWGVTLEAGDGTALYVPTGFAHGFQTLEDDTELLYLMGSAYHSESARGVRWDDPSIAIRWPLDVSVLSDRDRSFPLVERCGAS